jgi:hypothetical protein
MQIPSCSATYFALSCAIVSTTRHRAHPLLLMTVHRSLPHRALGARAARQSSPAGRAQLPKFLLRRADLRAGDRARYAGRNDELTWCSAHWWGGQVSPWPGRVHVRDLRHAQRSKPDQACAIRRPSTHFASWLTPYFALNSAIVSTTSQDALGAHQSSPASRTQVPKFLLRGAELHVPAPSDLGRLADCHASASGRGPPRLGWC